MSNLLSAAQLCAKLSTSLFSGGAVYCSLVEHPARLQCGTHLAATAFPPSFKRAATLQTALSLVAAGSTLTAYYLKPDDQKWLVAGSLVLTILPYTMLFMMPTNWQLLDPQVNKESAQTKALLQKWGYLHAVRSLISLVVLALINL